MICNNCIHKEVCKHKTKSVYECEHFKDGTIKNQYDRIRNMSVEEMADFMYSATDKICFENCTKDTGNKYSCKFGENVDFFNCIKCMKQYLESEVDTE